MNPMKLEFPEKKHEQQYLEMIQEFADIHEKIIPWSAELKKWENYNDFLERIQNYKEGKNIKPWRWKSELYFLMDNKDKIVWAEIIRYELTEELRYDAGNVGYGIRPSERKKWYATRGLNLVLEKCKEYGLKKILLTCNKENIWSAKTIIKNWWIWNSEYNHICDDHPKWILKERYWILIK